MSRNNSQRNNQITGRDGSWPSAFQLAGARKMASKPLSRSKFSHWKPRKSRQAIVSESQRTQSRRQQSRGTNPMMSTSEKKVPRPHCQIRDASLLEIQQNVG